MAERMLQRWRITGQQIVDFARQDRYLLCCSWASALASSERVNFLVACDVRYSEAVPETGRSGRAQMPTRQTGQRRIIMGRLPLSCCSNRMTYSSWARIAGRQRSRYNLIGIILSQGRFSKNSYCGGSAIVPVTRDSGFAASARPASGRGYAHPMRVQVRLPRRMSHDTRIADF